MTSLAQTAPESANARPSTGPRIVPIENRSSSTRLTRGLCGPHTVLPGEDTAEQAHLLEALLEEHKPAAPTETLLVAQLAQAQWKLNRIAAIEADLLMKQILQNEPNPGELQTTGHERREAPSLLEAFQRAEKSLAALARHEAAARRAFDRALSNLWKLQGARRRHDVERAACVNAPMPQTSRPEQNRDGHEAAAYEPPTPDYDNWNPISERPPEWLEPPATRSYIERHPESDTPPLRKADVGIFEA